MAFSFALLGSYVFALLRAARSLAIARREPLVSLREACVRATIHVLSVRVVELLLLVGHGIVLAHVHWLIHLAVLFVARELVRVNHGQHLGEALTNTGDSLRRVPEGKLVPRHELNALAVHVDETLLAGGARQTAERLLAEHGVLFVLSVATL